MSKIKPLKSQHGNLINGPLEIIPNVYEDDRGFFYESWNLKTFKEVFKNENINFVQDNHSRSSIGVLRGLHYQVPPFGQGKLVRCTLGEIYDVALDLRENSTTFGESIGIKLSSIKKNQFWIPEGFAHGFLTLSNFAEVQYKATNFWNKSSERSIKWNDEDLKIDWPIKEIGGAIIKTNKKDKNGKKLKDIILEGDIFL